ncbi:hypothetical protein JXB12_11245 [candidate division KSB1 bacterium]|nr:hypothetical protein [candidate division KSB1 bacterium]
MYNNSNTDYTCKICQKSISQKLFDKTGGICLSCKKKTNDPYKRESYFAKSTEQKNKYVIWMICIFLSLALFFAGVSSFLFFLKLEGSIGITTSDTISVQYDYNKGVKKTTEQYPGGNWPIFIVSLALTCLLLVFSVHMFRFGVLALSAKKNEIPKLNKQGESIERIIPFALIGAFLSIPGLFFLLPGTLKPFYAFIITMILFFPYSIWCNKLFNRFLRKKTDIKKRNNAFGFLTIIFLYIIFAIYFFLFR